MISTACTEHRGSVQTGGYGQIRHEGRNWLAHRLAWMLTYGPIPDGLNVSHRCDNPRCVNVGHLFLGTAADNLHDAIAKGRHIGRVPEHGVRKRRIRKLTDADVQAIRQSHQPLTAIAERYGVSVSHACNVRNGKR